MRILQFFNLAPKTQNRNHIKLQSRSQNWKTEVECLVTETINLAPIIPPSEKIVNKMKELKNVTDVSACEGEMRHCEILLGADVLGDIVLNKRFEITPSLIAIKSHFEWFVAGCEYEGDIVSPYVSVSNAVIMSDLSNFHRLEVLGIVDKNESLCENGQIKQFKHNLKFDGDRYTVNLLWKDNTKEMLKNNFEVASDRFQKLLLRFLNDVDLFNVYRDVIQSSEREGIIERVENEK